MPGFLPAAEIPEIYTVASPNERLVLVVSLDQDGVPRYAVSLDGAEVVEPSLLGLWFQSRIDLVTGFRVTGVERRSVDTTWEQPWGERRLVSDRHNELLIRLSARTPDRRLDLRFRVFDDGVGFRYEVPEQDAYSQVRLVGERTEFRVSRDARAFSQPANGDLRDGQSYAESPVGVLDLVSTPLTLRLESGVHLAIHEAALVDYPACSLEFDVDSIFRTRLRPSSEGYRAALTVPFVTPWRTVQVADNAVGLVNSSLILNLNEPGVLEDTSWIEPGKYVGAARSAQRGYKAGSGGDRRGPTTAEARRYIDFAAAHGFDGVLVDGRNRGGDGVGQPRLSCIEPYPDLDLDAVSAYARERGVRLIGHHEIGGRAAAYESRMDEAFASCEALGVRQVEIDHAGKASTLQREMANGETRFEWHDGQFAVNHYQRVVEAAARQRIAIDTDEPVKDTGLRRTWPNWLTRNGLRGMAFAARGETPTPAGHEAMLAFTRMLAGPMDYSPGIFDLDAEPRRVRSTLAKQLALYVVLYSPVQGLADRPENYSERPRAFRFIVDVPTDWEESIALAGAVGEYIVMARKERDGDDWYLGAVTDAHARRLSVPLDFLDPGVAYVAEIYADGANADWQVKPGAIDITTREYTPSDTLELKLAPGGGAAIRFRPVK
ncbi:MAG: glycoside hydrolase family 97 protein [Woeseiaceae bacterium]|nr:glycoside hydrolase family 97 protein [Woeseiaceae bacterium]